MNHQPLTKLCLVEDDAIMGESLTHRFSLEGVSCDWYKDATSALLALGKTDYAALVSDIRLPDGSAESMLQALLDSGKTLPPTLFITGFGSIDQAVRLLQKGARDYITKPFDLDELLRKLHALCPEIFAGQRTPGGEPVLGISPVMRAIQDTLSQVAEHDVSVLLTGESGVGKEYAARYLYQSINPEQDRPFIAINCAAVTQDLLEAELFGYEKGAFTGAERMHRGVFERAHTGVLFLDEIGDMSAAMQAKLLRTLQERTIQRVGGEDSIQVDLRLIFATNHDLKKAVTSGVFREDLYFRINVIHIYIPPLRERREDIAWFARRFIDDYARAHGVRRYLQPLAEQHLVDQRWPGNLRELQHTIERACILTSQDMLGLKELGMQDSTIPEVDLRQEKDLKTYVQDCEKCRIIQTLEEHHWRITETAVSLGISRKNLWEKMRRYGIELDATSTSTAPEQN